MSTRALSKHTLLLLEQLKITKILIIFKLRTQERVWTKRTLSTVLYKPSHSNVRFT